MSYTFRRFKELKGKIYDFTSVSSNLKPLVNVEVGGMCLAVAEKNDRDNRRAENNKRDYRRAQIIKVNQTTVHIFLVDFGVEEYDVPLTDLFEIPDTIIKGLPFQVIYLLDDVIFIFLFFLWSTSRPYVVK